MPDFLISLDPSTSPERLLALLKRPYGDRAPAGRAFRQPWGAFAVLSDRLADTGNVVESRGNVGAWVGELVRREPVVRLMSALGGDVGADNLRKSGMLDALNGAFALMIASVAGVSVVTDPMGSVQVYLGRSGDGSPVAVGTHPDLVARICGPSYRIDPLSVAEFLNNGIACCPYTMHQNVTEVRPGTVLSLSVGASGARQSGESVYFTPPEECLDVSSERRLVDDFVDAWPKAVVERCVGRRVAVQLSGGMDSRLVIATIPREKECIGVTLCDTMNREARFAKRVARCYGREWVPLERDHEYLGRTAEAAIRFTGCEGEWHHGHSLGFAGRLDELGAESVFTGLLMDNNFKGYYARDYVRQGRMGGLLPATFRRVDYDYAGEVAGFVKQHMAKPLTDGIVARRRAFMTGHFAMKRQSACEWLDGYPYSQACDNTGWVVERRVMPLRLPVMDRSLVNLAFRVPMRFKAGGRFFDQVLVRLLGPGLSIPSANDGVRPGSSHLGRLVQRGIRKAENTRRQVLTKMGVRLQVPHSWHDFPRYLQESPVLTDLFNRHGERLREFQGSVFSTDPLKLFRNPAVHWNYGYRLLQLATWRGLIDEYPA